MIHLLKYAVSKWTFVYRIFNSQFFFQKKTKKTLFLNYFLEVKNIKIISQNLYVLLTCIAIPNLKTCCELWKECMYYRIILCSKNKTENPSSPYPRALY
jgi:hypothetical protein